MRPHLTYDLYKWGMLNWYGFLQNHTSRHSPLSGWILAVPAGLASSVSWSLLAIADTIEALALSIFNLATCFYNNHLIDAGYSFARFITSGIFILTVPVVAPALFIRSAFMMIFESHTFATHSYDLFHKVVYRVVT